MVLDSSGLESRPNLDQVGKILDETILPSESQRQIKSLVQKIADDAIMTLDDFLEGIVSWFELNFGIEPIIEARKEFDWRTGKVFADDSFFHIRMTYFLEFFIFQRPFSADNHGSSTPFILFKQMLKKQLPSKKSLAPFLNFDQFHHSLFKITKKNRKSLRIQDLIEKNSFTVKEQEEQSFVGLTRSMIFQGFVFPLRESNIVSNGILIHPKESLRIIKKSLSYHKKSSNFDSLKFLSTCAQANIRYLRHRHVAPPIVYQQVFSS